jgi:hypothetical protein
VGLSCRSGRHYGGSLTMISDPLIPPDPGFPPEWLPRKEIPWPSKRALVVGALIWVAIFFAAWGLCLWSGWTPG